MRETISLFSLIVYTGNIDYFPNSHRIVDILFDSRNNQWQVVCECHSICGYGDTLNTALQNFSNSANWVETHHKIEVFFDQMKKEIQSKISSQ